MKVSRVIIGVLVLLASCVQTADAASLSARQKQYIERSFDTEYELWLPNGVQTYIEKKDGPIENTSIGNGAMAIAEIKASEDAYSILKNVPTEDLPYMSYIEWYYNAKIGYYIAPGIMFRFYINRNPANVSELNAYSQWALNFSYAMIRQMFDSSGQQILQTTFSLTTLAKIEVDLDIDGYDISFRPLSKNPFNFSIAPMSDILNVASYRATSLAVEFQKTRGYLDAAYARMQQQAARKRMIALQRQRISKLISFQKSYLHRQDLMPSTQGHNSDGYEYLHNDKSFAWIVDGKNHTVSMVFFYDKRRIYPRLTTGHRAITKIGGQSAIHFVSRNKDTFLVSYLPISSQGDISTIVAVRYTFHGDRVIASKDAPPTPVNSL